MNNAQQRFHALLWPHLSDVLRVAQILTGNTAEAEDLAQDTMLKAFRSIHSFADGTDARAWLLTILRNTRIDRLRSSTHTKHQVCLDDLGSEPPAPCDDPHDFSGNPADLLEDFSDREVIQALQSLPEDIRWTLLLVDVEGLDHKDAATILAVPVGTIKSRAHRGRQMLRQTLLPLAKQMRLTGS